MLTTKMMWMTRALLVLGVVGATPALGQTPVADITLSAITLPDTTTFTWGTPEAGSEQTFTVVVTNNGPSRASGVVVTVTRPNAGLTWPADAKDPTKTIPQTEITGFTGCTRDKDADGAPLDSCTIGEIVDSTPEGVPTEVEVTFDLVVNVPPLMPTSCPSSALLSGLGVSVDVDKNTSCAGCPANQTVPASAYDLAPYAKLSTAVSGPAVANQGQAVTYTASVTNLGPCAATGTKATITQGGFLTARAIKGTDCATIDQAKGKCTLGTIEANAAKALAVDYTVGELTPSVDFYSTGQTFTASAASGILDPGSKFKSSTTTVVTNTPGGCNSAAGGGLVGVLGLLAFAIRRRFT
jgi:hypothetical protein